MSNFLKSLQFLMEALTKSTRSVVKKMISKRSQPPSKKEKSPSFQKPLDFSSESSIIDLEKEEIPMLDTKDLKKALMAVYPPVLLEVCVLDKKDLGRVFSAFNNEVENSRYKKNLVFECSESCFYLYEDRNKNPLPLSDRDYMNFLEDFGKNVGLSSGCACSSMVHVGGGAKSAFERLCALEGIEETYLCKEPGRVFVKMSLSD